MTTFILQAYYGRVVVLNKAKDSMENSQKPVLVLVRGLPGSGKTHFAELLQEELAKNFDVVSLDPDATDYNSQAYKDHVEQQTADGVDPKLHPYRFLRAQAYQAIEKNKIVIWNQPFTNLEILQKVTDRLQEHASDHGADMPIFVVEVMTDPKIARHRVEERKKNGGHGPSKNTFDRFVNDYTSCAPLGYDTAEIDGSRDFTSYVLDTAKKITNLKQR